LHNQTAIKGTGIGLTLCRRAKALRGCGAPYFLLLTGHGDTQLHLEAIQSGTDDVLQKSWEPVALAGRFAASLRVVVLHRRIAELESQARKYGIPLFPPGNLALE
jgi:DNA-binding response OmpR family regulator